MVLFETDGPLKTAGHMTKRQWLQQLVSQVLQCYISYVNYK